MIKLYKIIDSTVNKDKQTKTKSIMVWEIFFCSWFSKEFAHGFEIKCLYKIFTEMFLVFYINSTGFVYLGILYSLK